MTAVIVYLKLINLLNLLLPSMRGIRIKRKTAKTQTRIVAAVGSIIPLTLLYS